MTSEAGFDAYIICTAPRSGSTLLCRLLAATGVAGQPGSHFHRPSLEGWLSAYDLQASDFASERAAAQAALDAGQQLGTGPNEVFGLRMQGGSFDFFRAQLEALHPGLPSDVARIEAAFGRTLFVHLSRADKLAQAISRTRAEQTGLWHRHADGSELERLAPPQEPHYDAEMIARHVAELTALEAAWAHWFERERIVPVRIDYDALAADPHGVLAELLDALGLDPAAAEVEVPTARLADEVNADWAERFRRDAARAG